MTKHFSWDDEREKCLVEIVGKNSNLKSKKWNKILTEFCCKNGCTLTPSILRNKWNQLTKKYRDTKLIFNASGAGTPSNGIFPNTVMEEFRDAHVDITPTLENYNELSEILEPRLATGSNALKVSDISDSSKLESVSSASKKRKSRGMDDFEKEILDLLKREQKPSCHLSECFKLLDALELTDEQYFKAVDILRMEGNAKVFVSLPECRRKAYLLNKI